MKTQHDDKVRFKQEAHDFFQDQSLEGYSIEDLLIKAQPIQRPRKNLQWYSLIGLTVLAILMLTFVWLPPTPDLTREIAAEVAKNHIRMKPLEIQTRDLNELRNYFTELDFSVAQSSRLQDRAQYMIGARYCSIKGVTSALLRYRNPQGISTTLYEVGYDPNIFGRLPALENNEAPIRVTTQGVSVTLWTENGLLMAEVTGID